MQIDPQSKAAIDYLVETQERKRSRRTWIVILSLLIFSLACLYAFNRGLVFGWIGNTLAIVGIVGVLVFLVFLSTKPYGRSDFSVRWWWFR